MLRKLRDLLGRALWRRRRRRERRQYSLHYGVWLDGVTPALVIDCGRRWRIPLTQTGTDPLAPCYWPPN